MLALPTALADFDSDSPEATLAYGRRLARALPRRCLILLCGDLGAGKTMLAKGLAEGLGVAAAAEVGSPTYTLIHEYASGEQDFYHIDLYRLATPRDLASLGLEDLLRPRARPAMVAVEWGEKLLELGAAPGLEIFTVELQAAGGDRRTIRARALPGVESAENQGGG